MEVESGMPVQVLAQYYCQNAIIIEPIVQVPSMKTSHYIKIFRSTGPRLNIKTVLSAYGDFHVKDKTAVRTSYL